MSGSIQSFTDTIYLLMEIECGSCHRRFAEVEGETESEVWEWAKRIAAEAHAQGWRDMPKQFLCPDCNDDKAT
jgi:hypothetical protein